MKKSMQFFLIVILLTATATLLTSQEVTATKMWGEVQKLQSEQKYNAALKKVIKIYDNAVEKKDYANWTKALIRAVALERGLHGYEKAVNFFMQSKWPPIDSQKAILHLFYANTLNDYYRVYAYEINKREKVSSKKKVDIKKWSAFDIFQEINNQYVKGYAYKNILGKLYAKDFPQYIKKGNYPENICATLRDFLVYRWVDFLGNTDTWKPKELKEKYSLNFKKLAMTPNQRSLVKDDFFAMTNKHPAVRMVYLLDLLYDWNMKQDLAQSALESQLIRIEKLSAIFNTRLKQDILTLELLKLIKDFTNYPWWSRGQYQYAKLLQKKGELVKSCNAAMIGYNKYPQSFGGKKCLHLAELIKAPHFNIRTMSVDRNNAQSLEIEHKNITKLYFRAYKVDFDKLLKRKEYYLGTLYRRDIQEIMDRKKPLATWQTNLEDLGDYKIHKTYIIPKIKEKGFFVIVASANSTFSKRNNKIVGTTMLLTDMVVIVNERKNIGYDVFVVNGKSGASIYGATVTLYQKHWRSTPQKVMELVTYRGKVLFPYKANLKRCFVVVRKGKQISFDPNSIYFSRKHSENRKKGCFIYTDRSIYRPLQKVFFKIVSYNGYASTGKYKVYAHKAVSITFSDPNGKMIEEKKLKTNSYGTASGEFFIPKGRVLGKYRLRCKIGRRVYGYAYLKVEEYKRPTFEIKLKSPPKSIILNKKANIKGKAKYYFGLPLTTGKVFYRITRQPVWPWWYFWFYGNQNNSRYTYEVASGNTTIDKDGTFKISFVPKASPELSNNKSISYNFKVSVEVTDEGGETRTARHSYPIGFVGIKAVYSFPYNYFLPEDNIEIRIARMDLSNAPRKGEGRYKLVKLKLPDKLLTPKDFPVKILGEKHTKGDFMRPRWESDKTLQQYLFCFKDGEVLEEKNIKHAADGNALVKLKGLAPGAYRLYYTSKDRWGTTYEKHREFIVAGPELKLGIPFFLLVRSTHVKVGKKANFFIGSGINRQRYWFEIYQSGKLIKRNRFLSTNNIMMHLDISAKYRGGFSVQIFGVNDYKTYIKNQSVYVPWNNKHLNISFKSFRNLLRPGQNETWTVQIKGPYAHRAATAEVLAYMYDHSLDFFTPHRYPVLGSLYANKSGASYLRSNLSYNSFSNLYYASWYSIPYSPSLVRDRFIVFRGYPIGGLGIRTYYGYSSSSKFFSKPRATLRMAKVHGLAKQDNGKAKLLNGDKEIATEADESPKDASTGKKEEKQGLKLRTNFQETAFFKPHLLTDKKGNVNIEFKVPDSVTSWNFYVHAMTKRLQFMTAQKEVVTRKDMMVRPYMPRFFREGDKATLKVVVNNATEKTLSGKLFLKVIDPKTKEDKTGKFAIKVTQKDWQAKPKGSTNVSWDLIAPNDIGTYAFKVIAQSKNYQDGELRPVPVLPGRIHLVQSKFVTLKDADSRTLYMKDLENALLDPTLKQQSLVVSIDAQLIYSVLKALPYLVRYPHECVEQTLNRFLSTGIVSSVFDQYPAISKMANKFSRRNTGLDSWKKEDPDRKMLLEETPWLTTAKGGKDDMKDLINVLDAKIVKEQRTSALKKLLKAQISNGAFPWWPGGPSSPYMTLYILSGFAKAGEFKIEVPKSSVQRAWKYLANYYREHYEKKITSEYYGYSFITFLNYVLSCYEDSSYYEGSFTQKYRKNMLEFSFNHWKKHSPYLKAYLALTLMRMDKPKKARLVMESIMDSAITKKDQGTFWAREDRSWLWYNDTIESHAFVLRALQEIMPEQKKHIDGLVLWLLLNKKCNQWKSTKATAEVIYSLVYTMKKQKSLGVEERAKLVIGPKQYELIFKPDEYTGAHKQFVIQGKEIQPKKMAKIHISKKTPGYMFASMTWHYSTEKLPKEARGDFLAVTRKFYLRQYDGEKYVLKPLTEGQKINIGDQVEVHLSIRSKHQMEYVHLKAPRGAGFEPTKFTSGHHWDLGIYWYEEIRDSGTNFFFERLPQGEYTFKYRLRATMSGTFRVHPATLQSMYAPEFTAFSKGDVIKIEK